MKQEAAKVVRAGGGYASRFIDVMGIRTHYLEFGDVQGPCVVLIHGGGAGANALGNWGKVAPILARDFRVIAVDMVGFGQTGKPDGDYEYSQGNRNAHLAAFITEMKLGPAALVGNSMGGGTALGVAMASPDLVGKLVLMGTAGLTSEITPSLAPILRYDFTIEGMRRLVDGLTGPDFRAPDSLIQSRFEDSIQPDTRRAYDAIMAWIGKEGGLFYSEEAIAGIAVETLVVNGKCDLVTPLSRAYRFLELLENSRGYILPHVGHWVMIEAPEEFAAVVKQFLTLPENGR